VAEGYGKRAHRPAAEEGRDRPPQHNKLKTVPNSELLNKNIFSINFK